MFRHPLFLVGFRPFFLLAFVFGAALPLLWAAMFSGALSLPSGALDPLRWHSHEMLFGFGWAVLGGFLLTASKNWVSIRGAHGGPLALLVLLWIFERVAVLAVGGSEGTPLSLLLLNLFGAGLIGYLVWTLVRYRKQDSYPDNWIFVVALPVFLVAKNLLLDPAHHALGAALSIGLFRVAFVVMFERTMTQFMKNGMGVTLLRNRWLDSAIKLSVLVCVFEALMPARIAAGVLSLAALLLFARLLLWKPLVGLRTFGIGIMYVGYFGLVVHLVLTAMKYSGLYFGVGSLATHAFTFLTMGLIIPAMLIRICQGHTGRKLLFTTSDRIGIGFMGLGAFARLVATQLWPSQYTLWITLAAIGWSACFIIVGMRVGPFLLKPRIDGREH